MHVYSEAYMLRWTCKSAPWEEKAKSFTHSHLDTFKCTSNYAYGFRIFSEHSPYENCIQIWMIMALCWFSWMKYFWKRRYSYTSKNHEQVGNKCFVLFCFVLFWNGLREIIRKCTRFLLGGHMIISSFLKFSRIFRSVREFLP